jgi:hypothetical protein
MSHKIFTWTLGLLMSSPALALAGSQSIPLRDCGGYARVYRSDHHTLIKLENVKECSNLSVNGRRLKMHQHHHHYSYVYTWKPSHQHDHLSLKVHSNSSRTEDVIRLQADHLHHHHHRPHGDRPVAWKPHQSPVVTVRNNDLLYLDESRNTAHLPSCGGRVSVDMEHQKLVVRLEGHNTCDRVRLTVFNQQPFVMESVRHLDHGRQVWTFHLPARSIRPGRNNLTLTVQDSHRNRSDLVRYYFSDQRWFFASGGR